MAERIRKQDLPRVINPLMATGALFQDMPLPYTYIHIYQNLQMFTNARTQYYAQPHYTSSLDCL